MVSYLGFVFCVCGEGGWARDDPSVRVLWGLAACPLISPYCPFY